MKEITVITTGGTIEKTYDEHNGALSNQQSIFSKIQATLRLPDVRINQRNDL
jgi:L-asparaginase